MKETQPSAHLKEIDRLKKELSVKDSQHIEEAELISKLYQNRDACLTEIQRLRAALKLIASCETIIEGDAPSIAKRALKCQE